MRGAAAGSVPGGGRARHGGAAEQEVGGRVALAAGRRLPLPAVDTLVRQRSLEGAAGGRRARKQWLQVGDGNKDSGQTQREIQQQIFTFKNHITYDINLPSHTVDLIQ